MTTSLTLTNGSGPDGSPVLAAAGEIDMSNAATFAAALETAVADAGPAPLTVDLTAVEYIDSAGMTSLFGHVERLRIISGPLLMPVLTISGLGNITTIVDA